MRKQSKYRETAFDEDGEAFKATDNILETAAATATNRPSRCTISLPTGHPKGINGHSDQSRQPRLITSLCVEHREEPNTPHGTNIRRYTQWLIHSANPSDRWQESPQTPETRLRSKADQRLTSD